MTKPAYQASIGILLKQQSKKRLSTSSLETLSIIAYKQPVTKVEVEQIRGVNCDYTVQKLLDKELIEIRGKSGSIGRPIIYGTSPQFMDYFGNLEKNDELGVDLRAMAGAGYGWVPIRSNRNWFSVGGGLRRFVG